MKNAFFRNQRDAQALYFAESFSPELIRPDAVWRLREDHRLYNLAPPIRGKMRDYFGHPRNIVWHRHASHGLSSQVCCLNFLGPLATQPRLLSRIVAHAARVDAPEMLPVEIGPDGESWFVGFEWTGRKNHLNEWAKGATSATRGANATSADAVVRFRAAGRVHTLLIEWKYTETYTAPLGADPNGTRQSRYNDKVFAPNGPIRPDLDLSLEDFLREPLYQLLRQQMLAWRMAQSREDDADEVRVLHISPRENRALHRVTSPRLKVFGDDVFEVFRAVMANPDDFVSRTTDEVFGPFISSEHSENDAKEWARYLVGRYGGLLHAA